jgi:tRNA A37 threonylcarbamoyladenosine synthetase subunit TsaC/SUA5/YrdC
LFANWDQAKLYLSLTESEINTLKQIKFDWPVTLIIENKHHHDVTPWNYLLNYKSIAFRVVKQTWLSKLIKITGPIFATSCNFTGEFPIKKWKTITKHLKINYVVKGVIDYYRTSILYDVINKKIIRG